MRIRLRELRRFIKEEVERNNRWMAGFFMDGGSGAADGGPNEPPPGLGDERDELDDNDYGEQQKSQPGARANDRAGRAGR